MLRVNNIRDGLIEASDILRIAPEIESKYQRSRLRGGELLITLVGTLGETAIASARMAGWNVARAVAVLPIDPEVGAEWVQLCLQSVSSQHFALSRANTTVQATLNLKDLQELPIPLPEKRERQRIVGIVGSITAKLANNRAQNRTLESLAQTIFKSWFIDFDPVRAKAEGREPFGMDAATAALFPNSFEASELGEVPKGWRVGVLDDLVADVLGGDWGSDKLTDKETVLSACIRGADIPDLQKAGRGKMPHRFLKESSLSKRLLDAGDIVVEISGGAPTQSTGRAVLIQQGLLTRVSQPLVCSNFCRGIKLRERTSSNFVYLWLRYLYSSDEFYQWETGTTGIKNFAYKLFSEKREFIIPDQAVLRAFDETINKLYAKMQANGAENETLAQLRDLLLRKLIPSQAQ